MGEMVGFPGEEDKAEEEEAVAEEEEEAWPLRH